MTKHTKRVLFYTTVVIFLFLSYIIILYAQGYKYNFLERKFERTGSIYLKTNVGADIYIDGEKAGSTSFLGNSHTVSGLLPGEYLVSLRRNDAYSSWEKKVDVQEGLVNEFSKIVLLPISDEAKETLEAELETLLYPPTLKPIPSTNASRPSATPRPTPKKTPKPTTSPTPSPITEPYYLKSSILYKNNGPDKDPDQLTVNVAGFMLSSDKNKLAYWNGRELWVMWLEKPNYQPIKEAGDKERVIRLSRSIVKAAWYKDEDWLVVDDGKAYKVIEIDTRGGVNVVEF